MEMRTYFNLITNQHFRSNHRGKLVVRENLKHNVYDSEKKTKNK